MSKAGAGMLRKGKKLLNTWPLSRDWDEQKFRWEQLSVIIFTCYRIRRE